MEDFESVSVNNDFIIESGKEEFESFPSSTSSSCVDTPAILPRDSIIKWLHQNDKNISDGGKQNACNKKEATDRIKTSTPVPYEHIGNKRQFKKVNPNATMSSYYENICPTYPKQYKNQNGQITPIGYCYSPKFAASYIFDTFDATNLFNDVPTDVSIGDQTLKKQAIIQPHDGKRDPNKTITNGTTDTSTIIESLASIVDDTALLKQFAPGEKNGGDNEKTDNMHSDTEAIRSELSESRKLHTSQLNIGMDKMNLETYGISVKEQITSNNNGNARPANLTVKLSKNKKEELVLENHSDQNVTITVINDSKQMGKPSHFPFGYKEQNGILRILRSTGILRSTENIGLSQMEHIKSTKDNEKNCVRSEEDTKSPNLLPIKTMRYQYTLSHHQNDRTLSCMPQLNLQDYLITLPSKTKMIDTRIELTIRKLESPIGISMLANGILVIGERGDKNTVNTYDPITGNPLKALQSTQKFYHPSDMVTLPDGRLVLRDNKGLHLFDEDGNFIKLILPKGVYGRCYGVSSDGRGNIITINTNPVGIQNCITKTRETDVLVIDFENDLILEKIELADIITNKDKSACRFIQCDGKKIYVADLGQDTVYILSLGTPNVKSFGESGKLPGQWREPAGLAIDSVGNMIIADASNNRLQVFDKRRNYLGIVKISAPINRPSGIYLDIETKSLYILNLKGEQSLIKVALVCHN